MICRRSLVFGASAVLAPFGVHAQQPGKVWRVGVLRPGPDDAVWRENFSYFRQGLMEFGFTEGINIFFEYRVRPGNPEEIVALANDLVRAKMDAILTIAPPGVSAAATATSAVPIVAIDMESDPIARGYATSLARPGANITGMFLDFPEMGGKWIQLLKEAVPKLARAAVLMDPAIGPYFFKAVEAAASSIRVQVLPREARSPGDITNALQSAAKQKAQALLVLSSPMMFSARKEIAALALKHRLPSIMPFPGYVEDGGMMAYGPNILSIFRQTAAFMAKILQGTRPAVIPIERPTRFEMVVNLKTAKTLGVRLPHSLLLRADRVIE